ncbi:LacI family DNA-binding transcriptional regulator [Cerasicoccus arenae]|uniref:LacI family DNA-binding transcriptional regulator n=1 Tax=Cerasicoccus arenae TaxID=424488 RepID=UPI0019043943|nr:LacI family DNA-binding transcriptional regulator [Cerasicoccus arenae]
MENRTVTIRDIAKSAGCSHTTVSLALRNHYRISEETRKSIQSLASRMGYQANPHIQTLLSQVRRGRLQSQRAGLALLSKYRKKEQWRQMPNNKLAIMGAFQRANELGYNLKEFSLSEEGMNFDRLRKILIARGILGILVAPTPDDRLEFEMDISPFAVVCMGQSVRNRQISMVSHYHAHSMQQILQELRRRGYKRVGCSLDVGINERIENAWSAHYHEYQSQIAENQRVPLHLRPTKSQPSNLLEYTAKNKLDVLITDSDRHLHLLRSTGMRIPDQLSYVCLSTSPGATTISGIEQNNQLSGIRAVELLVQSINNGVFGSPESPQYIYIPGKWVEGNTLFLDASSAV